MNKKLFAILFAIHILFTGCITLNVFSNLQPFEEQILQKGGKDKILVIPVTGIITDSPGRNTFGGTNELNLTSRIREELDLARKDPEIKALILKIDSPGGAVTATDIIYHEIIRYKDEMDIYVVSQLDTTAASGGYYLAVSGDKIIAHPTTITGSIGVIATMINIKGLMDKLGIEDQTIKSGKAKSMGSVLKKMTPEEQALFQEIIDTMYERFFNIVLKGRPNLTEAKLRAVADGRVLAAPQAKKAGLIDEIGYWDDAVSLTADSAGITNPTVITYIRPGNYKPNPLAKTEIKNEGTINVINMDTSFFKNHFGMEFMYLWAP